MELLSEEQKGFYDNEGYLILPNLYKETQIDDTRKIVFDTYKSFVEVSPSIKGLDKPWNHESFDAVLLKLRESDPKLFGVLYDAVQNNVRLARLVTEQDLLRRASELLDASSDMVATSGHYLRMDAPQDKRNILKWHQDHAYYHQNKNGDNGLVATIALQDLTQENGALRICPGSHKRGFLGIQEDGQKDSYEKSEQLTISDLDVADFEEVGVNVDAGGVLFINMNLFHRSGHNSSQRFRFTALTRVHKIVADDYVPFGIIFNYNTFYKEKINAND